MNIKSKPKYIFLMTVSILLFCAIFFSTQMGAIELDAAEVEVFLDGIISAQINQNRIPGAVISVVHNGDILFSKGYGYANLEEGTPVNPETTLFRPGSVSKLITWTAVMQLVEQGKLDLDEDINRYLILLYLAISQLL